MSYKVIFTPEAEAQLIDVIGVDACDAPVFLALTLTIGPGSPDFLWNLVALANFMRLSEKGAHAVLSSALWEEIRVREMAKKYALTH